MKKEFKKYVDKALERFFVYHELKGNNDDIRAFSVMLSVDAFTCTPPSNPLFGESLVKLTKKQAKQLKKSLNQ